jgi:antitoxin YefM
VEKTIGVSEARQNLMKLTRHIADNMDRLVLTNKGRAETVLLSLAEYQSLKAAAELAMHPEILRSAQRGFAELDEGQGVNLDAAFGQRIEPEDEPSADSPPVFARSKRFVRGTVVLRGKKLPGNTKAMASGS